MTRNQETFAAIHDNEQSRLLADYFLSTFESAYFIDLKDNTWNVLQQKEYLQADYPEGQTFTDVANQYLAEGVLPADRSKIDWICDAESIRHRMEASPEVKIVFTDITKGYARYCKLYVIRGKDADHVAIGFQDVDEEVRQTEERESILRRNLDIIEILASEYTSVYYIDLTTDGLTPYMMNDETVSEFGQIFNSGITYSEAFQLYVGKLILADDRQMMLTAGSIENIKKELKSKKAFLTQYRSVDGKYSEMKFVKVGGDTDEPKAVALGFAEKDDEVREAKQRELENERYYAVVKALSSEYSSIYYADIEHNLLMPYNNSKRITGKFGSNAFADMTYTQAVNAYVTRACSDKDKAALTRALSADYMREQLKDKSYYTLIYQNEKGLYCEMKCVRTGDSNPVNNVVVGFAVKDEEIRESIRIEEEKQRNFDIIEILASEYSSVYYIDLTTDGLTPYTMNAETESEFGQIFNSGITYSEAFQLYVDRLIFADDKQMMLGAGSIDNIKRELLNKKTFITQYRNSEGHYSEMKFVKVGGDDDEPKAVALGFADKDTQIREELNAQRYSSIANALSEKYDSIYYVDTSDDSYVHFHAQDSYTKHLLEETGSHFFEECVTNLNMVTLPEDRGPILEFINKERLLRKLKLGSAMLSQYRLTINGRHTYYAMRAVKPSPDDTHIIIAVENINSEVRQREKELAILNQNFEIIEVLASEYSSVYYIDLTNDDLTPYTMNAETESEFGQIFNSGITYSEAFKLYVNRLIFPQDKAMMLGAGSIENIKKELRSKKTFITQYRSADGKYSEMKFVKVGGDTDEPKAVALGFAEKDEQIRHEQEIEEERQRNFDIIEILASEYTSVYYIDLTTDGLNPYTMNAETETSFGSVFRSGISYSEAYRLYVDKLVLAEDKSKMLLAGSIGNIMKELRTKKTFLTTYRNSEGHYSEMKFVKVGNDEGIPTAVALGFADKDAELRARQEEERKLKRNIEIIEILASEYSSVYYIDLTTDELDTYTMNEQTESSFGTVFRSGIRYSEAFKMYVGTLVHPSDKEKMLGAGSIYNILLELSTKKTFITTYLNSEGHYCEMKFVKVGDEENPQSVALGFADKDEEIRAQMEQQQAADRDMAVITGLSDDFGCVVYASYDEGFAEHHYRFDPMFEKHIPGWSDITDFGVRLSRLMETLMHPDDRKGFFEATRPEIVREAVNRDNAYFVNFRILVDDEVTYYQAKFVKDEKSDSHVIAGFHNVDAETKREMDALDKAKAASQAKTDFLFNMSHDIRTPMNAIIGFTDMALGNIDDKHKVQDYLAKVKMSGKMLLSLINDILDMSRIESGKVKLNEEKTNIEDIYNSLEPVMSGARHQKDLHISFDTSGIRDRYVYMDQPRLERVLVNLISNAIKYTPDGGHVKARLTQNEGGGDTMGIYRFEVEDNGIGMSEEFQKRMWEEFAREETSTVSGIQGTGLGLSLARKLTLLMGGEISCRSKQGEGSTFIVTVPLRLCSQEEGADVSAVQDDITEIDLSGKKALLVEDNELNREIAEAILEIYGLELETAENGKEAVDTVLNHGPNYYDFILMDIQMPIMDGYEATRQIRTKIPSLKAPIIALSANAFEEDKKKSYDAGMDDHIAKPIDIDELIHALAKFLNK